MQQTLLAFNVSHQLLTTAEEVLWAGASAGAIGVLNSANFVQDMLAPSTRLRIVPESGFFIPSKAVAYFEWVRGIRVPYQDLAVRYFDVTFGSYIDPYCAAAQKALDRPEVMCLTASVLYTHIRPPVFYANNIFDSVILSILGWSKGAPAERAYLSEFGEAMVHDLTAAPAKDAILMPSCVGHCENLCPASTNRVNGYSYRDVLADWYFGTNRLPHRLVDDCFSVFREPCSKTCKGICVIPGGPGNGSLSD